MTGPPASWRPFAGDLSVATHLHIRSRWNDWYANPETEALATAPDVTPAPLTAGFRPVSAIGVSMGACAALALAACRPRARPRVIA